MKGSANANRRRGRHPLKSPFESRWDRVVEESRMKFINTNNEKWHSESHYPTQAKGRLEWGTQRLLLGWQRLRRVPPISQINER